MVSTVSRSLYTGTSTDTRAVARSIGVRGRNRDTTAGIRCVTGCGREGSVIVDTVIGIAVERSANEAYRAIDAEGLAGGEWSETNNL